MKNKEYYLKNIESITEQINRFDNLYFSKEYIMKMFGLEKNKIRKNKINKLFND